MKKKSKPKAKKTDTNAKHKREGAMLEKLQAAHGYALLMPGRGMPKTQMMFDGSTKKMSMSYMMRLAVPSDSALGQALAKEHKEKEKGKKVLG